MSASVRRPGRMQRREDRLVFVDPSLRPEEQQRLARDQRNDRDQPGAPTAEQHSRGRQRQQQRRHQLERVQHEHQRQNRRRADARACQVPCVDRPDPPGVQHEAQAYEQAGAEEERQQRRVIGSDVPQLPGPGHRVLQLQRIERIDCGGTEIRSAAARISNAGSAA